MKLTPQLNVIPHHGRHTPVNTARHRLSGRQSWLLSWSVDGMVYEGEASPLDGFGTDSSDLCRSELSALDARDLLNWSEAAASSPDPVRALVAHGCHLVSPAARFAVECCVLNRVAEKKGLALWQLLHASAAFDHEVAASLPVSAVIDPSALDWWRRVELQWNAGIRTFKLKVGRDLGDELASLRRLSAAYGPALCLRIDANQMWSPSEVDRLANESLACEVQWLEDPTSEADGWRGLNRAIPLAADEILIGEEPSAEFLQLLDARFLVLKPMALGGFSACLAWTRVARQTGRPVSVSHLFDGPRALDAAIHLAFAVQTPGITPGLGLHAGLDGWAETSLYARSVQLLRPPLPSSSS